MSPGYPSRKLPLWADFLFLNKVKCSFAPAAVQNPVNSMKLILANFNGSCPGSSAQVLVEFEACLMSFTDFQSDSVNRRCTNLFAAGNEGENNM